MATTPTSTQIPSELPRDLKFNAGKIDEIVNSADDAYKDRFGKSRLTWAGIENISREAIAAAGYVLVRSFATGATITSPNQALLNDSDGEYYRWNGQFPKVVPANSTPQSTGGVGGNGWIGVGDASLRAALKSYAPSQGDALVSVKSNLSNAIQRTQHDKNSDFVSVKDFGVVGDGIVDDSPAFQKALSSGASGLIIPAGTRINLSSTCLSPARNFAIIGEGPSSVITGTASVLVETTASANSSIDGKRYTVKFRNVHFTGSTDNQSLLYLHSVFDYGGSMPFVVEGCTFTHGARNQTSVMMRGITGLRFINNTIFSVSGFSAKTDNTGYGLRAAFGDDISTSVMNIHVAGNSIISISRPIYAPPRTVDNGGRCEGVRIGNNLMGDGILGIFIDASIAVSIVGNQVSDYLDPIRLSGCQGFNISDNAEITGYNTAIEIINGFSNYVTHNGVISGNSIGAMQDNCTLINLPNLGLMSDIAISNNTFKGWILNSATTYGIRPNGSHTVDHSLVTNNTFRFVKYPVFFGASLDAGSYESFKIHSNTYNMLSGDSIIVSFPERMAQAQRYSYSQTYVQTLTAGMTTIAVDVTAAKFLEIPVYADAQVVTSADTRLVYLHDSSTFSQLVFAVKGTAPTAGSQRICLIAIGSSQYGY